LKCAYFYALAECADWRVYVSRSAMHSQKKGTKAVTGAVPFQKANFCPF